MSELDGLFCALALSPNVTLPGVWLAEVWGEGEPLFASPDALRRGLDLTMTHYNDVTQSIAEDRYVPAIYAKAPKGARNRAQHWAFGFVLGMGFDSQWERLAKDRTAGPILLPMMMLADAESLVGERLPKREAEAFIDVLPSLMPVIKAYWSQTRSRKRTKVQRSSPARKPGAVQEHESVHRLKIELNDVRPPIWRRVEIESDAPLSFVSKTLLAAMGWTDTHLHSFSIRTVEYGVPAPNGLPKRATSAVTASPRSCRTSATR